MSIIRRRKKIQIKHEEPKWPHNAKWKDPSVNRHYMTTQEMKTVLNWWEKGEWGRAQLQSCFVRYPSSPPAQHIEPDQRIGVNSIVHPPCCPQGTSDAITLWSTILTRMQGQLHARVSNSPPGYMVVWGKNDSSFQQEGQYRSAWTSGDSHSSSQTPKATHGCKDEIRGKTENDREFRDGGY